VIAALPLEAPWFIDIFVHPISFSSAIRPTANFF
jgi:hypothetical protein